MQFILTCSNHLSFCTPSLLPTLGTIYLPSCHFTRPCISPHSSPSPLFWISTQQPLTSALLHSIVLPVPWASVPPALPHTGRGNLRPQLDSAMQDVSDLYLLMEETEKQAVRRALLEERGRYCTFINMLQPVVVRDIYPVLHPDSFSAVSPDVVVL